MTIEIDTDLFVVLGMMMALMAIPSIIGSMAEERFPYIAVAICVFGTAMLIIGMIFSPNGYSLSRIPHSFVEILARVLN